MNYKDGTITKIDRLAPSYVDLRNPRYLEVDGKYYSTLIVIDYSREHHDLLFKRIVNLNENIIISMHFEKQDRYKVIRDLTYNIGNVSIEMENMSDAREDSDIAAFTFNDAIYIRKEMQINNQDMYFFYTYITVYENDVKKLKQKLDTIDGILRSEGIYSKKAFFRQEQAFRSCLPLLENNMDVGNISKRNILTKDLAVTYPFITSSIYDRTGIFIGEDVENQNLIFIDKYDKSKYTNSNMAIFGKSGVGKSYFTKLNVIRNNFKGVEQYIIDPDREYHNIANKLGGTVISIGPSSKTYINIFDIRENSLEENQEGYLATKLTKLMGFFKLLKNDWDTEEESKLEKAIIKTYKKKGITFNDNSLYKRGKFKKTKDMPIMEDLYKELDDTMKSKISIMVNGSMRFLNNYTNVNLDSDLIIGDIYELNDDYIKFGIYIFIDIFWDRIKSNTKINKAIYIDEIWKIIGETANKDAASFVYKIFKTIRKYNGSAVSITQDVSDLFTMKNGTFGKTILNNSEFKVFFYMEEENIKVLENNILLSDEEKVKISSLSKGECLICAGRDHILTKIISSEIEGEMIGER